MRLTTQPRVCGGWPAVSVTVKTDRIPGSLTDYRECASSWRSMLGVTTD